MQIKTTVLGTARLSAPGVPGKKGKLRFVNPDNVAYVEVDLDTPSTDPLASGAAKQQLLLMNGATWEITEQETQALNKAGVPVIT